MISVGDTILTKTSTRIVSDVDGIEPEILFTDGSSIKFSSIEKYPDSYVIVTQNRTILHRTPEIPEWAKDRVISTYKTAKYAKEYRASFNNEYISKGTIMKVVEERVIEKQVLINGINIYKAEVNTLINLIKTLKKELEDLHNLQVESKYITKKVSEYDKALARVIKELDSREA